VVAETVTILVVEDDDGHATLVERNLRRAGLNNSIVRLRDGQEAIDYFFGGVGRQPEECVLLLDINMPRVDGVGVLRQLKADPRTDQLPVVILTTTDDPREVKRCYELGCAIYVTKPVEYDRFVEAIRRLGLEPKRTLIRGGTDGSRLTEKGLPTPNLFTGGHLYHSEREWICVEDMGLAAATIIELARLWAE